MVQNKNKNKNKNLIMIRKTATELETLVLKNAGLTLVVFNDIINEFPFLSKIEFLLNW